MIDPKLLRGDLTDLQQQLATRGYVLPRKHGVLNDVNSGGKE